MLSALKILLLSQFMLLAFLAGSSLAAAPQTYTSDYFSFIGQDESGYLLFALDNSRAIDGKNFTAEHFGVLYEQHRGWIDLVGMGEYPNPLGVLNQIPDSETFQFSGRPNSGIRIQSRINDLRLEINPLLLQLEEVQPSSAQSWSSAAAVLYWQGRTIPGRVIAETRRQEGRDRLTHRYSNSWNDFQGFYLALQTGPPADWQDVYLRSEGKNKKLKTRGFIDAGRDRAEISAPDLKITRKGWSLGLYRWNKRWEMHLKPVPTAELADPLSPLLTLKQISRQSLKNWIIGGYAMSVVEGTIEVDGRSNKVLGFVEMIK